MPLYEYQCDDCANRFERIQKYADPPIAACPSCGGGVKKLPSSPAIQFKGSGWYITDYAKKGAGGKDGKESGKGEAASGAAGTAESSGDKGSAAPSTSASSGEAGSSSTSQTSTAKGD